MRSLCASAGVFLTSGIKVPFLAFFAKDTGKRVKEAPFNMLLAMAAVSTLCLIIGILPEHLYNILPFAVDYVPYTTAHVITQLQLLLFSALAFLVLVVTGIYPAALRSINLDTDWVYRRFIPRIINRVISGISTAYENLVTMAGIKAEWFLRTSLHYTGPHSTLARTWEIGSSTLCVMITLAICLLLYYI